MFHLESIPVTDLIISAMEARKKAYAPYSGYMVGAALLTNDLRIYTGCNIENAAFTRGFCAERLAISKAGSAGWWKGQPGKETGNSRPLLLPEVRRERLLPGILIHVVSAGR